MFQASVFITVTVANMKIYLLKEQLDAKNISVFNFETNWELLWEIKIQRTVQKNLHFLLYKRMKSAETLWRLLFA